MVDLIWGWFVAIDKWLNVKLLKGNPDETITKHAARAWKEDGAIWGCVLCKLLNLVDKDHCRRWG